MPSVAPSWVPLIFHEVPESTPFEHLNLGSPWVKGSYLWATDGRIMVRRQVKPDMIASLPEAWRDASRRRPDLESTWKSCLDDCRFGSHRKLPTAAGPRPCSCLGMDPECEECDGSGEWFDAKSCVLEGDPPVRLLSRYVHMLRRNRIEHLYAGHGPESAVYFHRWDEKPIAGPPNRSVGVSAFEGFLMPCVMSLGAGEYGDEVESSSEAPEVHYGTWGHLPRA